jgi:HD-GYP domain-containing protein (c-di-GMP phosphodiesterase class II)
MSHAHHHDDPSGAAPPDGAGAGAPKPAEKPGDSLQGLSLSALRALMSAIAQRRIYPPQHPIASRSLSSLALYLERILSRHEEWRLAIVGSRLVAGGGTVDERPEVLASFIEDLRARGFDTIVFRRGLEADELRLLISLMILDPRNVAGADFQGRLAAEGVRAIEVGRMVLDQAEEERTKAVEEQTGTDLSEVYHGAIDFIQETILGFREGRKISLQEAESFVRSVMDQVRQDRSPFLILTTLKSHHPYTFTHIINVCILTIAQVEALGASPAVVHDFGLASMMHDIGKSLVPREVLSKPGKLTPEEFALIQRHPQDGVHILRETPGVPDLALIVAFEHHMRYNHRGYPNLGHARPLHPCSLMTNLADTYDAMRSRRAYQQEYPPEKVAALITDRAGVDYDPLLARAFLQIMGTYPPGTRVRIDSGEEALVVRANPANPSRPCVRILRDTKGVPVQRLEVVDLSEKEAYGGRFARTIVASITTPAAAPPGGSAAPAAGHAATPDRGTGGSSKAPA